MLVGREATRSEIVMGSRRREEYNRVEQRIVQEVIEVPGVTRPDVTSSSVMTPVAVASAQPANVGSRHIVKGTRHTRSRGAWADNSKGDGDGRGSHGRRWRPPPTAHAGIVRRLRSRANATFE